jgi:hypothetical protein
MCIYLYNLNIHSPRYEGYSIEACRDAYLCVNIFICMYIHVSIYTYMHIFLYNLYDYSYIYTYKGYSIETYWDAYLRIRFCSYMQIHVRCKHIQIYTLYTYIIYMFIHISIHIKATTLLKPVEMPVPAEKFEESYMLISIWSIYAYILIPI